MSSGPSKIVMCHYQWSPDKRFLERRRGAPSGAIYVRGGEGGRIWHRRGALEFRRFDEVRRDLGLELRRGDALAAAAQRGEHVDDRVDGSDGGVICKT